MRLSKLLLLHSSDNPRVDQCVPRAIQARAELCDVVLPKMWPVVNYIPTVRLPLSPHHVTAISILITPPMMLSYPIPGSVNHYVSVIVLSVCLLYAVIKTGD